MIAAFNVFSPRTIAIENDLIKATFSRNARHKDCAQRDMAIHNLLPSVDNSRDIDDVAPAGAAENRCAVGGDMEDAGAGQELRLPC